MRSEPILTYALAALMGTTGVSFMVLSPRLSSAATPVAVRAQRPGTATPAPPPGARSPAVPTTAGAAVAGAAPTGAPVTADVAPSTGSTVDAGAADVTHADADAARADAAQAAAGAAAAPAPPAPPTTVAQSPPSTTAPSRPPARPPDRPTPTTVRARAAAAQTPESQLDEVERIATSSGWDWRAVHVHFRIGFKPEDCCHWGVYDPTDHKTIWIGPTAFANDARLRYVVLHELGHAWQWHSHRLKKLQADMAPWGYEDIAALEAGADCIATLWGADTSMSPYWTCPPDAQALMSRRLAGQWK